MKKTKIILGTAIFAIAALFVSCSNPTTSTQTQDQKPYVKPFSFSGPGERTDFKISADSENAARAVDVSESLAEIVRADGLCQSLSIDIIYDEKISYKDFTGFDEYTSFSTYCENTVYPSSGPMYNYDPHNFVWVTYRESSNETVVILKIGDWDGKEFIIKNILANPKSVRVYYQIGVLDTSVPDLKNPRFVKWNKCLSLIKGNEQGDCYLTAHISKSDNKPIEVSGYGLCWADTVAGDDCYGLSCTVEYTPSSSDDFNIQFANDGEVGCWVGGPTNFLDPSVQENGQIVRWWCCCKDRLSDNVPKSLQQDLPNWEEFYNTREIKNCGTHGN